MSPNVFVMQGDISRLMADAVAYSTSTQLNATGYLYAAFQRNLPGFEQRFAELGEHFGGRCKVGDAFWLALESSGRTGPRGVVVTPAAGHGPPPQAKRRAAVIAAINSAIDHLDRDARRAEQLLVALPAFGFGLGGDRRRRLESARAQLTAAHETLSAHQGVDAAFVAYTADAYEVFVRARREVNLAQDDLLRDPSVLELIDAIRKGECVVFAGAGLSQGAGLPSWSEFVQNLARDLGAPTSGALEGFLDIAQWYVEEKGETRLAEQIRKNFGPGLAQPTLPHYLLMSLPVRVVVTTNYDDLLEQALDALRRGPIAITEERDVSRTGHGESVSVVKLHGDAAIGKRFVLSRDDFDRFLHQRPAMASLFESLLLNHSFFFVGYGLRDPNFRQIYGRIADILQNAQRKAFAVMIDAPTEITPFLRRQWANKGVHLLFMPGATHNERVRNLWRFLDQLAEAVNPRSLLLADDADVAPNAGHTVRLDGLRRLLRDRIGDEVQKLVHGLDSAASQQDALLVAEVLGFLTDHGWRPGARQTLSQLWERLADAVSDPYQRRRLLVRALRHAEQYQDIIRLHQRLAELG